MISFEILSNSQRMNPQKILVCLLACFMIAWAPTEWMKAGDYEVKVNQAFMEVVKNSSGVEENIFYIDVECKNMAQKNGSCRVTQWEVFDTEDFKYESEYLPAYLYKDRQKAPLTETVLSSGAKVRGWVAFKIPAGKKVSRFHFFTGYVSAQTVTFPFSDPAQ